MGSYTLPDPLVFKNGKPVTTAREWDRRRKELFEEFDREIYGRVPKKTPKVTWEVTETKKETKGTVPVISKTLVGHVDNRADPAIPVNIQLTLTTPENAAKPIPVIMEFGFVFPPGFRFPTPPGGAPSANGPTWQEQVLAQGLGLRRPRADELPGGQRRRSTGGGHRSGEQRGAAQAGRLGLAARMGVGGEPGAGLLRDRQGGGCSARGIEGLSRYGKATLVTMAYEPRFAIGFVGSSGAGGAKLYRRDFGEKVENLAGSGEYHWMAGNFVKYAGPLTPSDLPVDAHELIALCAPRPVFISCGSPTVEGNWVDSRGAVPGGVAAGPVYRLLGKKDLGTSEMPLLEQPR